MRSALRSLLVLSAGGVLLFGAAFGCGLEVVGQGSERPSADAGRPPPPPGAALPPDAPLPPPPPPPPLCDAAIPDLVLCLPFEGSVDNLAGGGAVVLTTDQVDFFSGGREGQALLPRAGLSLSAADVVAFTPTPRTVEAWVNWDGNAPKPESCIVTKGDELEMCLMGEGKLRCGKDGATSPAILPLKLWTHVACVRTPNTLLTYVNGVEVNSKNATEPTDGVDPVEIAVGPAADKAFPGMIDSLRIWKTARSAAEIAAAATR